MRYSFIAIFWAFILLFRAAGQESSRGFDAGSFTDKWELHVVKLDRIPTLKELFDSGLRPYRFPSLERSLLEVKHKRLKVELESIAALPEIKASWLHVFVFDDGTLANLECATPPLSIDDSRIEIDRLSRIAEIPREELEDYFNNVRRDPVNFDDPFQSGGRFAINLNVSKIHAADGGPLCSAWFRKTFNPSKPLAIYYKISWGYSRPAKDARLYKVQIPAPPGYENVSLDAPPNFGPDVESPDPAHKLIEREPIRRPSSPDTGVENENRYNGDRAKEQSGVATLRYNPWTVGACIILVLCLLLLLWRLIQRRNHV